MEEGDHCGFSSFKRTCRRRRTPFRLPSRPFSPQVDHQRIGQRGQQQTQSVGRVFMAARTPAKQVDLRILDPVLGLVVGAVQPLVQSLRLALQTGLGASARRLSELEPGMARALYAMFLVSEVHPFDDGNGRLARLVMNAELSQAGQCRIIIPTLYRETYLDCLRALSREADPKPYIKATHLNTRKGWLCVRSVPELSLCRMSKVNVQVPSNHWVRTENDSASALEGPESQIERRTSSTRMASDSQLPRRSKVPPRAPELLSSLACIPTCCSACLARQKYHVKASEPVPCWEHAGRRALSRRFAAGPKTGSDCPFHRCPR